MAISQTQIVDYLNKKVGYGVAKTDLSTAKYPFNESIASPLLVPGATVLQQDYAIPNVSSAPSANTVLNGSTIVSVYNASTSAVVQGTALSESETNETWSTGITNWIPPSFGSGYQLKIYAGPPGASASTAATYTNLPVAGSGNSDSWFFDYQAGVLNFADTNVPTAAANVSNVVYFMGAVYTGTLGIANYANLSMVGNLTSINGNIVLTNGNVILTNGFFEGNILGGAASSAFASNANVAAYFTVTPLTNNQTFYLEFANISTAGNSTTGVVSSVNVNPSTGTVSATAFSGTTATLSGATQSTSASTGALIVTGGAGIGANLTVGGNATIAGNLQVNGTLTYLNTTTTQISGTEIVAGVIQANSGTASTSTTTGALQVLGGAGITGAVYAGSIQNTPIGSTTASSGSFTTLSTSGLVSLNNTTQNTGSGTGALQVSGGAYIAGNLFVGGNINLSQANVSVFTGNSGQFFGNAAGYGALYAGISSGYVADPYTVTQMTANFNNYAGVVTGQNLNSGPLASADIFLTPDNGTFNDTYLDMGIASSTYSYPGYSLIGANDAYLFNWGNATTGGGNLIVGTGAVNDIIFAVQGINTQNEVMRITRANVVAIKSTVSASSTTTGALTVAGGVGITGAVYAGSIQSTPIGSTTPSTGVFTTTTTTTVNATNVNSATIGNIGAVIVGDGGTLSNIIAANIAGTVTTANVAEYVATRLNVDTTNAHLPIMLGNAIATGNSQVGISSNLWYDPVTQYLNASNFSTGGASGTVNTNILTAAVGASNVTVFNTTTANINMGGAATTVTLGASNVNFNIGGGAGNVNAGNVNATTVTVTTANATTVNATTFNGAGTGLTGTASGLTVGSAASATDASYVATGTATNNATYYPTFVGSDGVSYQTVTVDGNGYLQYNPSSGNLSSKTAYIGILGGTASTSTVTGALVVNGGLGVSGNINVGTTTSQHNIMGNLLLGNGTVSASAVTTLEVNQNSAAPLNSTSVVHISANSGAIGKLTLDSFANPSIMIARRADGTSASPTAAQSGDVLGGFVMRGYGATGFNLQPPSQSTGIVASASQVFTDTAQGTILNLITVPTNSNLGVSALTISSGSAAGYAGTVAVTSNTQPTSASTGAFTVVGGVGIQGNLNIGNAAIFNSSQGTGNDFIVQGKKDSTLIWARPNTSYDTVIIGNSATASNYVGGAKLNINTTDSILLPVGTAAQRPGSVGFSDITGMLRYSTTQGAIEWYNGTSWASATTSFTVVADSQFTGTGSQTVFTLPSSQTTNSCLVSINGVMQIPTTSYSVSGTTLTFTEAPLNTDIIDVRMITTTATVNQLYDTSGYNTVNTITGTGITFTTGTNSAQTQYTINTSGAIASTVANVTISTANSATTVDSFFSNTYSTAKYILTSTFAGVKEATEALVVTNGTVANVVVWATINTAGNTLTSWSATMSGNIVQLQGTTTNNGTVVRMTKLYNAN